MHPALILAKREVIRFSRERSRMIGVIVSPILFWLVIGSGLNRSFQHPGAATDTPYLEYFYPGSVVLIILFAAIFSSMSVIEDRREGFMQSVLVAPISRLTIVMGKVIGIGSLAGVQGIVFLLAAPFVIPTITIGSLLLTALVLLLLSFGLASLGLALAWAMDSTQGFHAIMNLLLVPLWMLSGSLFPSLGASEWVARAMQWNPLTYGVAAVRLSLYGLLPKYAGDLPTFGMSVLVLTVFALVMGLLAVWRVGRQERGVPLEAGVH